MSFPNLRKFVKAFKLFYHPPFRRGLLHGVGASIEHRQILFPLFPVTVVDIGANIGQFSLLARALFPKARIHAFEPLGLPAARFAKLFAGDAQVTLHHCAIGPEESSSAMNISGAIDSSSLLPITDAQANFAPGTGAVGVEQVTVRRLDSILKPADIAAPALLKLDVQGFELPALQGCGDLLNLFSWVYVEVSFVELYGGQALASEIVEFLQSRGFVLAGVANPSFLDDGTCVQADFLFRSGSTAPA